MALYSCPVMETHLLTVIIAIMRRETPTFPYCMKGMAVQRKLPCVHLPSMNLMAMKGNTARQNRQSAAHKLKGISIKIVKILREISTHLIIKSDATFLTLGHLISAIIVNKFPKIPTTIIVIVAAAANVSNGRENLRKKGKFLKLL